MDTEDTGDFIDSTVENNREKPSDSFNGKGITENTDIEIQTPDNEDKSTTTESELDTEVIANGKKKRRRKGKYKSKVEKNPDKTEKQIKLIFYIFTSMKFLLLHGTVMDYVM